MSNLEKFNKQILLKEIGRKGQEKIANSSVLIVGLGGLGSPLVRYLASSGVGKMCLIDDDIVEIDNLPRQTNYSEADLDHSKIEVTARVLQEINPEIELKLIEKRANEELLSDLVADYQIIIDASDNFKTKFILGDLSHKAKKIFISGSFLGFKGYVSVYKSGLDSKLPCFRCFHPDNLDSDEERACYKQGVLSPAVGVVGLFMATEALKELVGIKKTIAGQMMFFDFLNNNHHLANISKKSSCFCGFK